MLNSTYLQHKGCSWSLKIVSNPSTQNGDGELSYSEFQVMIDPPAPPQAVRPHVSDLGMQPQVFSPDDPGKYTGKEKLHQ